MSDTTDWQAFSVELAKNAKRNLDAKDDEIDQLKAQLKEYEEKGCVLMDMYRALKSRVSELEHAYTSATTWEDVGDVFKKQSSIPWLLRKQADAVESVADKLEGMNLMYPDEFLRSNAQHLRAQADEAERTGGKS